MEMVAARFIITDHALERFEERSDDIPINPSRNELSATLLRELEESVPFGVQHRNGELRLLPSGLVAATNKDGPRRIVLTILTKEHAVANMQANGVSFRG
jgi:hypothetical protein